jgi:hypothetical protein
VWISQRSRVPCQPKGRLCADSVEKVEKSGLNEKSANSSFERMLPLDAASLPLRGPTLLERKIGRSPSSIFCVGLYGR